MQIGFPLYILRHGETAWNVEGRMQGDLHSDLTETGRAQAAAQGRVMRKVMGATPGLAVFCSPQRRALDTLEIVLDGVDHAPVTLDTRLAEVGMGDWRGLTLHEIGARWPEANSASSRFEMSVTAPGGEGFDALQARVRAFLDDLCGPSMVVTHGMTACVLRGLCLGLDRAAMGQLDYPQGKVIVIADGQETMMQPDPQPRAAPPDGEAFVI